MLSGMKSLVIIGLLASSVAWAVGCSALDPRRMCEKELADTRAQLEQTSKLANKLSAQLRAQQVESPGSEGTQRRKCSTRKRTGLGPPCSTTLQHCMSTNPVSCRESDDIQTVSELMKEHQVRRIPVVDSQSTVVGIVATADLAREEEVDRRETGPVLAQISQDITNRLTS
jgi:predicted transcriptional regulator